MRKFVFVLAIFALIALAVTVTAIVNNSEDDARASQPFSVTGTWTGSTGTAELIAVVKDGAIEINWKTEDAEALYWKGSFLPVGSVGEGTKVVSIADRVAMENSFMASQDTSKAFVYRDGKLEFNLTVMGVKKTIRMSK